MDWNTRQRMRDQEERNNNERQVYERKQKLDAWLAGRTDGGVPVKPPLDDAKLVRVSRISDPFGGHDVGGELVAPPEMIIEFKATFRYISPERGTDWFNIEKLDVRMRIIGDPRIDWHYWTRANLTPAEHVHLENIIVSQVNKDRKQRADDYEAWLRAEQDREFAANNTPEALANRRSLAELRSRGYTEYQMRSMMRLAWIDSDGSLQVTRDGHTFAGAFRDPGNKLGTHVMTPWGIRVEVRR